MAYALARARDGGVTREELWHGNRERPATWLSRSADDNIMLFAWRQHPVQRELMAQRAANPRWLRLSGQRAVDAWLASLRPVD